jgi:hypothetical protein
MRGRAAAAVQSNESSAMVVFRLNGGPRLLRFIDGDQHHDARYRMDSRRIDYRIYVVYCAVQAGLHSSLR